MIGKPAYLRGYAQEANLLRLLLQRADVHVELWEDIVNYVRVWKSVMLDADARYEFHQNPSAFLEANGIPASVLEHDDIDIKLIRALYSHPDLQSLASDYHAFFQYLKSQGIVAGNGNSALAGRLREAIRAKRHVIEKMLSEAGVKRDFSALYLPQDVPLYEIEKLVSEANALAEATKSTLVAVATIPVAALAIAFVLAVVATYAAASVDVLAYLNLGASIAVFVDMSLWVCGPADQYYAAMANASYRALAALDDNAKRELQNILKSTIAIGEPCGPRARGLPANRDANGHPGGGRRRPHEAARGRGVS